MYNNILVYCKFFKGTRGGVENYAP